MQRQLQIQILTTWQKYLFICLRCVFLRLCLQGCGTTLESSRVASTCGASSCSSRVLVLIIILVLVDMFVLARSALSWNWICIWNSSSRCSFSSEHKKKGGNPLTLLLPLPWLLHSTVLASRLFMIICVQLVSCSSHVDAEWWVYRPWASIWFVCLFVTPYSIKPCPEAHTCTYTYIRCMYLYPCCMCNNSFTDTDTSTTAGRSSKKKEELTSGSFALLMIFPEFLGWFTNCSWAPPLHCKKKNGTEKR